jgi:hypothetical protein
LGKESELPLVAEFSFDHDLGARESLHQGAQGLFQALQRQTGWVDLAGTTKTAYAYEGF